MALTRCVPLALLLLFTAGCAHHASFVVAPIAADAPAGQLLNVEHIDSHRAPTLRFILWMAGLPEPTPIESGVDYYRLHYRTTNYDNNPVDASGLLAIPKKGNLRGVVSYQHGTRANDAMAPSKPTLDEGILIGAAFSGAGYMYLAPDYIGQGPGEALHPYLHAETEANATIDLIRAARALCAQNDVTWPERVFLTGFSQGGHATAAAHRALEQLPDLAPSFMASAPIAPACDLAHIAFPYAIKNNSSLYLAYMCNAYSIIYSQPLASVIAPAYVETVPVLFDGKHDDDEVAEALPANTRDLFTPEFLADYGAGKPTWLTTAMEKNGVFQWTPKAPTRLYYGTRDTDVSPEESPAAAAEMTKRGGNATAVCVGDVDHVGTAKAAIPKVRKWFNELAPKAE